MMARSKPYTPRQNEQLKLSRTQVSMFKECPRCFYMKKRHGIGTPGSPPYLLNSAVDGLLKNEFEIYRESQTPHRRIVLLKFQFLRCWTFIIFYLTCIFEISARVY